MLNINETSYELEGIIRNSNQEVLAEMVVDYSPARAQTYRTQFYSLNYDLIYNDLENKEIFMYDMIDFLDKAYEYIMEAEK